MKLEGPLPGGPPAPPTGNIFESTELLSKITASKVLFSVGPPFLKANTLALPLYGQIPAVKAGQAYFTDWFAAGPVGEADAISDLQKEVFGVAGLEATLAGTGKGKASRSGVADVDVGPTEKRVCWDIATSGNVGRPRTANVVDKHGTRLFSLGRRFAATGCTSVKLGSARSLLRHPGRYRVSIDTAHTNGILIGALGAQSPAFFGNGKDRQFNQ